MSLEKITARLFSDSDRECGDIVAKAEKEAERVIENAKKEAAQLIAAEKESAAADAEKALEKARSAAASSEKRAVLAAKSELIGVVLSSAKEKFMQLDDEKYFSLLEFLAKKNLRPTGGTMLLSEKDFKRCPSDFASRLGSNISIEGSSAVTDGGFILKYGDVEINCTLGALFTAYADELKAKASEILFG